MGELLSFIYCSNSHAILNNEDCTTLCFFSKKNELVDESERGIRGTQEFEEVTGIIWKEKIPVLGGWEHSEA